MSLDCLLIVLSEYTILCKKSSDQNYKETLYDSFLLTAEHIYSWFIIGLFLMTY